MCLPALLDMTHTHTHTLEKGTGSQKKRTNSLKCVYRNEESDRAQIRSTTKANKHNQLEQTAYPTTTPVASPRGMLLTSTPAEVTARRAFMPYKGTERVHVLSAT